MDKIRVSLLGSTGMVGQKMIRLLENHPYIEADEFNLILYNL